MIDTKVYFDMDGVLCDWESQFNTRCEVSLSAFQLLSQEQMAPIKSKLFCYDFFCTIEPLDRGMLLFRTLRALRYPLAIITATGYTNRDEVARGKLDWVRKHIGLDIPVHFVYRAHEKGAFLDKSYSYNILVDDRQEAIDAWERFGGKGILFAKSR